MERKKVLRTIDANFNRSKEGLRVVEDIYRFICNNGPLIKKLKKIRHSLDGIIDNEQLRMELLRARNTKKDKGKKVDILEMNRKGLRDIMYINYQRAKESIRVLEELFKIIDKKKVTLLKKTRYDIYAVEKETFTRWATLCNSR